jgi:hypothetical protein
MSPATFPSKPLPPTWQPEAPSRIGTPRPGATRQSKGRPPKTFAIATPAPRHRGMYHRKSTQLREHLTRSR